MLVLSLARKEVMVVDPEELPWEPIEGLPGLYIKVLSRDPETGAFAALVKFEKGAHEDVHTHRSDHDVIVLEGYLIDGEGRKLGKGTYLFAPAGVKHGPFDAPEGCILFAYFNGPL